MKKFFKFLGWLIAVLPVTILLLFNIRKIYSYARKHKKDPYRIEAGKRYKLAHKVIKRALFIIRIETESSFHGKLPTKPCLIIANHKSNIDPLVFIRELDKYNRKSDFPIYISIIAKDSIGKSKNILMKIVSKVLLIMDSLFIDRTDIRQQLEVYNKQLELVKEKKSILVFLEGTRVYSDDFGDFKAGALKVAYKTYIPIVPVVVNGSSGLIDKNKTYKKGRKVKLTWMEPIQPQKFVDRDMNHFCNDLKEKMHEVYLKNIKTKK